MSCRLARDQIRGFAPRKSGLQLVDWIQLILYIVAYILCVLMTPLDDELTYEWGRNPRFYDLTFTSGFKSRLNAWLGMNVIRTVCAGIGWLLVGAGSCSTSYTTAIYCCGLHVLALLHCQHMSGLKAF
jgi:hypothetical protein